MSLRRIIGLADLVATPQPQYIAFNSQIASFLCYCSCGSRPQLYKQECMYACMLLNYISQHCYMETMKKTLLKKKRVSVDLGGGGLVKNKKMDIRFHETLTGLHASCKKCLKL